eukprot:gene3505-2456_t
MQAQSASNAHSTYRSTTTKLKLTTLHLKSPITPHLPIKLKLRLDARCNSQALSSNTKQVNSKHHINRSLQHNNSHQQFNQAPTLKLQTRKVTTKSFITLKSCIQYPPSSQHNLYKFSVLASISCITNLLVPYEIIANTRKPKQQPYATIYQAHGIRHQKPIRIEQPSKLQLNFKGSTQATIINDKLQILHLPTHHNKSKL